MKPGTISGIADMLITDATNLPRLMECNGSRNMPASFPMLETDPHARNEGTAAHWLAQQFFEGVPPETLIGKKAPNGVIITDEMHTHVDTYLSALDCGEIETNTSFAGTNWEVRARCDHWKYGADGSLTVDDFKYGHSLVEPENNWTLIAHAIGICDRNQIVPAVIHLRIHQPRAYHTDGPLRTWSISEAQLTLFKWQINTTLSNPSDTLNTGLAWCRRCPALATCPAARSARMNIIDAIGQQFSDELPDDALAYELGMIETAKAMLEAQYDSLKELILHRLRNGAVIDNYALESQYANTRFKSGITPQMLTMVSGVDCTKPDMITPAEFLRRGGSQATYDALTERPLTGSKLVRVSADKRARRLLNKKG